MGETDLVGNVRSAQEVLGWAKNTVDAALRAAVDQLSGSIRHIAGYHLGWWDEAGRRTKAGGGKAIRPALVLLAAQAVGRRVEHHEPGTPPPGIAAAVAVELAHNFSLLHDDVMDCDLVRRHRQTAWRVFGVNAAILTGDALLTLAMDVLAASGNPAARAGIRSLSGAVLTLIDGQSADLDFEDREDITLADYVGMAERKTAALLACCCSLGASFGGGSVDQVNHLGAFGQRLGLAFQFVDDLLGIWGDPAHTGKPVHADLRQRKKSMPVVAALNSKTPAAAELAALYHSDQRLSSAQLVRAAELVEVAGGRQWSQTRADEEFGAALRHLASAEPEAKAAAELGALARLATRRDR